MRPNNWTLRGSADIFSAKNVVRAAGELERMGRDNQMEKVDEALLALDHHVKQLIEALERAAKDSPSS